MSAALSSGRGRCRLTARIVVVPTRAASEMGADGDLLQGTLHAVHRVNRTGETSDFLAVALPAMGHVRDIPTLGDIVVVHGSPASLERLLIDEGFVRMCGRGLCRTPQIQHDPPVDGVAGAAFVRDRSVEKKTAGWSERNRRRAMRRGVTIGATPMPREGSDKCASVGYGDIVLHVRKIDGECLDPIVEVTTYGFSSRSTPSYLPMSGG